MTTFDCLYIDRKQIGPDAQDSANFIEYLRRDSEINRETASHIATLWKDDGIRATFELRGKLSVPDSCRYFFDNVKRIANADYLPSDKDILLVRKRTTGIIEEHFVIKGTFIMSPYSFFLDLNPLHFLCSEFIAFLIQNAML